MHWYPRGVAQRRKFSGTSLHLADEILFVQLILRVFSLNRATAQTAQKQQFEYGFHKRFDYVCKLAIIQEEFNFQISKVFTIFAA
jgi:hypothetical protein